MRYYQRPNLAEDPHALFMRVCYRENRCLNSVSQRREATQLRRSVKNKIVKYEKGTAPHAILHSHQISLFHEVASVII